MYNKTHYDGPASANFIDIKISLSSSHSNLLRNSDKVFKIAGHSADVYCNSTVITRLYPNNNYFDRKSGEIDREKSSG